MVSNLKNRKSLFVIADLHVGSSRVSETQLIQAFKFMNELDPEADYIIDGDLTTSGKRTDFKKVWYFFETLIPNRRNQIITLGNHDVRGPYSREWSNAKESSPEYFKKYVSREYKDKYLKKLNLAGSEIYFSLKTSSINFVVLNSEKGLKDAIYLSDKQLMWIENQLQYGKENDLINILVVHEPLSDTHFRSNENGGFGPQDQQLKVILEEFPNTVILSGHIHNGLNKHEVVRKPYGICVDIPGFSVSENAYIGKGIGYHVKIGKNSLNFESWDFVEKKHLGQFDFKIEF